MRMMQRVRAYGRSHSIVRLATCLSFCFSLSPPFSGAQNTPGSGQTAPAPVSITLEEAIRRAQVNEPAFAAASADSRSAALDRSIARSALLPGVTYHNQYLYTQGTGLSTPSSQGTSTGAPRFIANNAVHEYISQGVVDETVGLAQVAGVRHADAAAAFAAAELEISRRGLLVTVNGLFYGVLAADRKLAIAEQARSEATDFT